MPGPVHFLAGMTGPRAHKTILFMVLLPQPHEVPIHRPSLQMCNRWQNQPMSGRCGFHCRLDDIHFVFTANHLDSPDQATTAALFYR